MSFQLERLQRCNVEGSCLRDVYEYDVSLEVVFECATEPRSPYGLSCSGLCSSRVTYGEGYCLGGCQSIGATDQTAA